MFCPSTSEYNELYHNNFKDRQLTDDEISYNLKKEKYLEKVDENIKLCKLQSLNLEYCKTPIKYEPNIRIKKYNDTFTAHLYINYKGGATGYDCKELFKIEKIKNRYYCCKNRIDLFNNINKDNIL